MKLFRCVVWPLLVVALLFCSLPAFAQTPEPRLKGAITETARVVLSDSRTPRARSAQDMGAVSPDTAVPGITLVFKRSAAQEATLKEMLAAQQNTASPLYHHWLSPETFAARFGVADEDIAATESWLASRGFHVERVARSRDRITFSGTAAQVQAAFGTELHHYRTEGELHFAPASDLALPAELASVTAAVLHLSDFRPKPNVKAVETRPHPDYTTLSTQTHYLGPKDIATMYNLNALYSNNFDGLGQGLAVVGQSVINTQSIVSFQTVLSRAKPVNTVLVPGSGVEAISPGDEGESEIDLEYASGIAQEADIFLVYVGANQNYDVFDALAFAITENIAPVVSISYSTCESLLSQTDLDQGNALFEEAAAQGQTLVAATGDSGSTACAFYTSSQGVTPAQQQALAVNFPASSPYVTAVGGTQMAAGTFTAGANSYWASASSIDSASSLLSYVPEVVWNEGSVSNGIAAGGGGTSAYFPRPSWQAGVPGITNGAYRLLPDVALQSSIASPGFLVCSSDPALIGSQAQSCTNGLLGSNNKYTLAGGTSFAAPVFAGFIAIQNQVAGAIGQGSINPVLYSLATNPTSYAAVFHDITSGTNACLANTATCSTGAQSNYAATAGFDEATGLGSVDFSALAAAWPISSTANLQPTRVSLLEPDGGPYPGGTVRIQITVQSAYSPKGTSAPTGGVSISVDGAIVDASLAFSSTSPYQPEAYVTYNWTAPTTTGAHLVIVTYPGDATHSASTATYSVVIGNVLASGGLSLSAGNLTIANGGTGSTPVTVTPNAGYTGNVVWSLAATGSTSTTNLTACYAIASLPVSKVSTTQLTVGIGTACNSALPAERGNFQSLGQRASTNDGTPAGRRSGIATAMYASLLICGLLAGRRHRIRLPLLLTIAFLTVTGLSLTGCGGGGNNTGTPTTGTSTTPSSSTTSYNVTLTAKDSVNTSITASTTFTLTVK
jgi:Pro-kumamolisin, activation domain